MEWTPKEHTGPRYGDSRERVIFAVKPRLCTDGKMRWLEKIRVKEVYSNFSTEDGPVRSFWEVIEASGL